MCYRHATAASDGCLRVRCPPAVLALPSPASHAGSPHAPPSHRALPHPTPAHADSCNRLVATAGADGYVRVWDFKGRGLRAEIRVGAPVARVAHHAGTGLMAAACEDHVIRMYDLEVGAWLLRAWAVRPWPAWACLRLLRCAAPSRVALRYAWLRCSVPGRAQQLCMLDPLRLAAMCLCRVAPVCLPPARPPCPPRRSCASQPGR